MELTRTDVVSLLSPGSLSSSIRSDGVQTFYREDETIDAIFSTGKCENENFEFLPWDAWNVPLDTLIGIEIMPKDDLTASDLGIDLKKLKKERPYRTHKNVLYYFDKDLGVAVYLHSGAVKNVRYFPSRDYTSRLCASKAIRKYFRGDKWRYSPEPKNNAVDFNMPAIVTDVSLTTAEDRNVLIIVNALDPENDVLTYNYKVSAGRIVGVGAKVTWDLSGQGPGTYTIICAVDDGIGFRGRYVTKSITLN